MANAKTSAQHYLECEDCEERPSKFLCKTCFGHLCEICRNDHERKKLTRGHVVVPLTSNNLTSEEMLYCACSGHIKKKLEYHCIPCDKSVCAECIGLYHKGHAKKSLTSDLKNAERVQYGDEIKGQLGKHALDALRMLGTMFESAFPPSKKKESSANDISMAKRSFPPSKKKEPSGNDISQENMPNKSTTCIVQ